MAPERPRTMDHSLLSRLAKAIGGPVVTVTSFDEEAGEFLYKIQIRDISVSSDTSENALDQLVQRVQMMALTRAEHAAVDRALGHDEEAAEEAGRQWALDREDEQRREDQRRSVPGVAELEDFLGGKVEFSSPMDEDGHSGLVRASIVVGGVGRFDWIGATDSAAVAVLRRGVAHELREIASDLESPPEE